MLTRDLFAIDNVLFYRCWHLLLLCVSRFFLYCPASFSVINNVIQHNERSHESHASSDAVIELRKERRYGNCHAPARYFGHFRSFLRLFPSRALCVVVRRRHSDGDNRNVQRHGDVSVEGVRIPLNPVRCQSAILSLEPRKDEYVHGSVSFLISVATCSTQSHKVTYQKNGRRRRRRLICYYNSHNTNVNNHIEHHHS